MGDPNCLAIVMYLGNFILKLEFSTCIAFTLYLQVEFLQYKAREYGKYCCRLCIFTSNIKEGDKIFLTLNTINYDLKLLLPLIL